MTLLTALQDALPPRRALESHGVDRWIYLGEDTAWRLAAEGGELQGLHRVALGEGIEWASRVLRDPWIDWVGRLSVENASLEWWASELAAKNPFTLLFPQACSLLAAREAIGEGMLAVCPTPAAREELETMARSRGIETTRWEGGVGRSARRIVAGGIEALGRRGRGRLLAGRSDRARVALESQPAYRRRQLERLGLGAPEPFEGEDAALLFTWADRRSVAADGSYRDPHLGELPELLSRQGLRVAYVPRLLPGAPFAELASALAGTGERMLFPDALLSAADWDAARRRAAEARFAIPDGAEVATLPVARLAREHLGRWRWLQVQNLMYEPLVRTLAATGVRPRLLVFPFEGHGWEQVLAATARKHMPAARVVGYDNVNFSRLALSLYPAAVEIGLRPLPDRIVTNGPAFERVLLEEGLPRELVVRGCGLRHAYLHRGLGAPEERGAGPVRVLVATSIDRGQSVEVARKAIEAFGGDERYQLVVKPHPVNEAEVRAALAALPAHGNVSLTATPIPDLLRRADVLLYTYSVVCYEALAAGVQPVFVKAESFIDLDQLEPFPRLRRAARTAEELRAAADEAAARTGPERAQWRREARAAVDQALAPVSGACAEAFLR